MISHIQRASRSCCYVKQQWHGFAVRPPISAAALSQNLSESHTSSTFRNKGSLYIRRPGRNTFIHAASGHAWQADQAPDGEYNQLSAMITREITSCNSLAALESVFLEWGGSFANVNAAAAVVKFAKLPGRSASGPLFQELGRMWLKRLPDAGAREYANVLWACSRLGAANHRVWSETWQAYIGYVRKDLQSVHEPTLQPQNISNVLWACAKLRKQPAADELQLLLQAFLQPAVLSAATAQAIANVAWAVGVLSQLSDWQAEVSQEDLQQLLSDQQLQTVIADASAQHSSNVLLALARMATCPSPLLSMPFAQQCAKQLLAAVPTSNITDRGWTPQHITNAMWACGELQLADEQFVGVAVAAAPQWIPLSTGFDLTQAATACAQLQYRNEVFMQLLLQQGLHLLQASTSRKPGRNRPLSPKDKASLAALCCSSVMRPDMQQLADIALALVASSSVDSMPLVHPSSLRRLWEFHNWLLQHQLLDGRGLAGLLTQQQLQQGAQEAAQWSDKARL